jgi:hypothetical protein
MYRVGDRVKIKSLEWYNENKDDFGRVDCGFHMFTELMSIFCGHTMLISSRTNLGVMVMKGCPFYWTDEMIEGPECLTEYEPNQEDVGTKIESTGFVQMGKIVSVNINNANYEDEVELQLEDYKIEFRDGKIYAVKKKPKYPTTYNDCCDILGFKNRNKTEQQFLNSCDLYDFELMTKLSMLKACRDAYWKIYGEQMGLDGPWKPDWDNLSANHESIKINKGCFTYSSRVLVFPTKEMRDEFNNNFRDLIEQCEELL